MTSPAAGHPFLSAKKDAKNRRSPMQRSLPPQNLGLRGQPALMVNALHRAGTSFPKTKARSMILLAFVSLAFNERLIPPTLSAPISLSFHLRTGAGRYRRNSRCRRRRLLCFSIAQSASTAPFPWPLPEILWRNP